MSAALIEPQRPQSISNCSFRVQRHRPGGDPRSVPVYSYSPLSVTPWPDATAYRARPNRTRADDRQAAYYLDMLTQHLLRINHRIDRCRTAIVAADAVGDVENLAGFRRLLLLEQQERRIVVDLIVKLERRFLPPAGGGRV